MVQGEHEILAQVKQAYQTAQQGGFIGKTIERPFFSAASTWANACARKPGWAKVRPPSEAWRSAWRSAFSEVCEERSVMILGAGEMAEVTARHLLAQKVKTLLVANRTFERACRLAEAFGGTAMHFEEGLRQMEGVDIVICSTAAPHAVITPAHMVREVMEKRKGRSAVYLIDIAMPRDVDPAVNDIENVYLYNIDDLQQIVSENQAKPHAAKPCSRRCASVIQMKRMNLPAGCARIEAGLQQGLRHLLPRHCRASAAD